MAERFASVSEDELLLLLLFFFFIIIIFFFAFPNSSDVVCTGPWKNANNASKNCFLDFSTRQKKLFPPLLALLPYCLKNPIIVAQVPFAFFGFSPFKEKYQLIFS